MTPLEDQVLGRRDYCWGNKEEGDEQGSGLLLLEIIAASCSGTLSMITVSPCAWISISLNVPRLLLLTSSTLPITSALPPLLSDRITKAHSGVSWLNKI